MSMWTHIPSASSEKDNDNDTGFWNRNRGRIRVIKYLECHILNYALKQGLVWLLHVISIGYSFASAGGNVGLDCI